MSGILLSLSSAQSAWAEATSLSETELAVVRGADRLRLLQASAHGVEWQVAGGEGRGAGGGDLTETDYVLLQPSTDQMHMTLG